MEEKLRSSTGLGENGGLLSLGLLIGLNESLSPAILSGQCPGRG